MCEDMFSCDACPQAGTSSPGESILSELPVTETGRPQAHSSRGARQKAHPPDPGVARHGPFPYPRCHQAGGDLGARLALQSARGREATGGRHHHRHRWTLPRSWLQRNAERLVAGPPGLQGCLDKDAAPRLRAMRSASELPRDVFACLIDALAAEKPKLLIFDVYFTVAQPQDRKLAASIRRAGNVLLLAHIGEQPVDGRQWPPILMQNRPVSVLEGASLATAGFLVEHPARKCDDALSHPYRPVSRPAGAAGRSAPPSWRRRAVASNWRLAASKVSRTATYTSSCAS